MDSNNSSRDRDRMRSYIERELRSLGDVVLTDGNANLELRVTGMEVNIAGGGPTVGYFISAITLLPTPCGDRTCWLYWNHTMFSANQDGLARTSEDVVSWFDQDALRQWRTNK